MNALRIESHEELYDIMIKDLKTVERIINRFTNEGITFTLQPLQIRNGKVLLEGQKITIKGE